MLGGCESSRDSERSELVLEFSRLHSDEPTVSGFSGIEIITFSLFDIGWIKRLSEHIVIGSVAAMELDL